MLHFPLRPALVEELGRCIANRDQLGPGVETQSGQVVVSCHRTGADKSHSHFLVVRRLRHVGSPVCSFWVLAFSGLSYYPARISAREVTNRRKG